MSDTNKNPREWHPDNNTLIIDEQTKISPISLKLCCMQIIDCVSDSKKYDQRLICSQLDELLAKSVGAITPTAGTLFGVENKAYQNTHKRPKLATLIADKVRLYLGKKLTSEAKEIALRDVGDWLAGVKPPRQQPQEPSNERAKKAFAKAVEAGYMEETANGYKWLYNGGSQVSLGYFVMQVYSPDNTKQIPLKALGRLFGFSRLERAVENATTVKKPQSWREPIDNLLKEL